MQVMSKAAAKKRDLWGEYLKIIAPPVGRFKHFETEQQKQDHAAQVAEAQKQGAPF